MKDIHEKILEFLLDWRATRDADLRFTLRRNPTELLQQGYWFNGNVYGLYTSFWTGKDAVNKTPNIYLSIDHTGRCKVCFSAKDNEERAEVLEGIAVPFGAIEKKSATGKIWEKMYQGNDYMACLRAFLEEDKNRIDKSLAVMKDRKDKKEDRNNIYIRAFEKGLNELDLNIFEESLRTIQAYRHKTASPEPLSRPRELYLRALSVENIGLFDALTIELGQRATVFIGENGCGKSTLLRAAALGLLGSGSEFVRTEEIELQRLPKISAVDSDFRPTYSGNAAIRLSYQYAGQLFENGQSNYISLTPPAEAGNVDFEDSIASGGFGIQLGESSDGELPYLVLGYPQQYFQRADGIAPSKRPQKPNAYDALPLIHKRAENRVQNFSWWLSENWKGEKHAAVAQVFEIISEILSKPDEEPFTVACLSAISPEKISVSTPANPKGLPFELLSTGLNNLFGTVGHIISRFHEAYPDAENPLHEPAVIFIDEVDNYLHPEVQAKLMRILLDKFQKAQFIVTAHSPIVLAALPNEGTKAYRIADGQAYEIEHFYGRTVQDLLNMQFGVEKRPAREISQKIHQMVRALTIGGNEFEAGKRLYDELKEILGADDPAIEDASYDLENT